MSKFEMDPQTATLAVNTLLMVITQIIQTTRQVHGQDSIPTLEEILIKNAATQAQIDAEKKPA